MSLMQNPTVVRERFVCPWGMASASADEDNPFGASHGVHEEGGWDRFWDNPLEDTIVAGFRREMLHRPYLEATPRDIMDIDSRDVLLNDPRYNPIIKAFERRLAKAADTDNRVDEWIIYLGSKSARMERIGGNHEHLSVLMNSVGPLLLDHPKISIAIDASSEWHLFEDARYVRFIQTLQAYKRRQDREVYIEAYARNERGPYEWQQDFPQIALTAYVWNQYKQLRRGDPTHGRLSSPDHESIHWYSGGVNRRNAGLGDDRVISDTYPPQAFVLDCILSENVTPAIKRSDWIDPDWTESNPREWIDSAISLLGDLYTEQIDKGVRDPFTIFSRIQDQIREIPVTDPSPGGVRVDQ